MGVERLPFVALEIDNDPNNAAITAQRMRMDYNYEKDAFIRIINELSEPEFYTFCIQVINWQHFFYKLRGTVGTESKEYVPKQQIKFFKRYSFNIKKDIELTEPGGNEKDPGIIIQRCTSSKRPRDKFIDTINQMKQEEFENFCTDIELLCYFANTQNGSYFSHHPELIARGHEHFWFND